MTDRQNQLGRDHTTPHRDDGTRPRPNGALNEKGCLFSRDPTAFGRLFEGDDYKSSVTRLVRNR